MKLNFKHGERVTYSKTYKRVAKDGNRRVWVEEGCSEKFGILVRIQNLSNGLARWNEYGNRYEPQNYFKAALVSPGMYLKPVLVPIHNVKIEGND